MKPAALLTDDRARGFVSRVDPLRYAGAELDELEPHGTVIRWIQQRAKVLDVGCGTGEFARALEEHLGCEVVGVEPNVARASVAEGKGLRVHREYLTAELAPTLGRFDVVAFMDVLEHVADPVELLVLARSLLCTGGCVIVSVPNVAHWTVRLKLLAGRFDYEPIGIMDATHLRWFTARTVRDVMLAAGLTVVRQTVSRGTWLPVYRNRRPCRWVREGIRRRIIDGLCSCWPGLFGCQHLIQAVPV